MFTVRLIPGCVELYDETPGGTDTLSGHRCPYGYQYSDEVCPPANHPDYQLPTSCCSTPLFPYEGSACTPTPDASCFYYQ